MKIDKKKWKEMIGEINPEEIVENIRFCVMDYIFSQAEEAEAEKTTLELLDELKNTVCQVTVTEKETVVFSDIDNVKKIECTKREAIELLLKLIDQIEES